MLSLIFSIHATGATLYAAVVALVITGFVGMFATLAYMLYDDRHLLPLLRNKDEDRFARYLGRSLALVMMALIAILGFAVGMSIGLVLSHLITFVGFGWGVVATVGVYIAAAGYATKRFDLCSNEE